MISVREALDHVFALSRPVDVETVPLRQAAGRVLAKPVTATRSQPPFATSTMDGYAIAAETAAPGDTFEIVGEAAAGHRFEGALETGQAVRIFTGAPIPTGARRVLLQEDVERKDRYLSIQANPDCSINIRAEGADFNVGDVLAPPRILTASDVALIAAMNVADVVVSRKPIVALIATGDELVLPGETPGPDQIIASNALGLAAMVEASGGIARILPIARDRIESLHGVFDLAAGADLVVTIGGASVGDHDLVGKVAELRGFQRSFYKIAMRPGKPLMAGRMGDAFLLGLPGNPVSSIVCGRIFMQPMLDVMRGLPARMPSTRAAVLANDIPANGPREHYMRGHEVAGKVTVAERQDSGLLSVLATANVLVVRPPHDPAKFIGDTVQILDF